MRVMGFLAIATLVASLAANAAMAETLPLDSMDEGQERWGPASAEASLVKQGGAAMRWQPESGAIRREGLSADLSRYQCLRLWVHAKTASFARIKMTLFDDRGGALRHLVFKVDWQGWNRMELPPWRFRGNGDWAAVRGISFEMISEGFEPTRLVLDGLEQSTEPPQIHLNDHEVLIDWLYYGAKGLHLWKPTEETRTRPSDTWGFVSFWSWGAIWLKEDAKRRDVCAYEREFGTDISEYDTLEVRVSNDANSYMSIHVRVDGKWSTPVAYAKGTSRYQELQAPLPRGGKVLDAVRLDISEPEDAVGGPAGRQLKCNVSWVLLRKPGAPLGSPPVGMPEIAPAPLNGSLDTTDFPGGIYFSREELPGIRKLFTEGSAKSVWEGLRKKADGYLDTAPEQFAGKWFPGGYWVAGRSDIKTFGLDDMARVCALAYVISGEKKYGDMARRALLTMARIDHWVDGAFARYPLGWGGHGNPFAESEISYKTALAYDWAYTTLSDAERREVADALLRKGVWWTVDKLKSTPSIFKMNQGVVFDARIGPAVMALESAYPDLAALRKQTADWLWGGLSAYSLRDGASTEGPGYWHFTWNTAVLYLAALAKRDPQSVLDRTPDRVLKAMDWFVHMKSNADPDYRCIFFCDGGGNAPSDEVASFFAKYLESPTGAWFQKRYGAPSSELSAFMWEHDTPATTPPMIRSRHFRGAGYVILRDGFDYGDTLFTLLGQPNLAGHNQHDRCSFTIEGFGDYLAMDPGMISYSDPAHRSLADTRLHNAITLSGADSRLESKVTAFFASPAADYAAVDGTKAYPQASRYMRHALYIRPDTFVIYDDMALREPARIEWNLNSEGEWSQRGPRLVAEAENGSLVVDFAEPRDIRMETETWPCGYAGEKNNHATIYRPGDRDAARFLVKLQPARLGEEGDWATEPIVAKGRTVGLHTRRGSASALVLVGDARAEIEGAALQGDGEMSAAQFDDSGLAAATLIGGTRMTHGDKTLIAASKPGNYSVSCRRGWAAASIQAPAGTEVALDLPSGAPQGGRDLLGSVSGNFRDARIRSADGRVAFRVPPGDAPQGGYWLLVGAPQWLTLDESAPARHTDTLADGRTLGGKNLRPGVVPKTVEMQFAAGSNPIDADSLAVFLRGRRLKSEMYEVTEGQGNQALSVRVDLAKALGPEAMKPETVQSYDLEAEFRDRGLFRRRTSARCRFSIQPAIDTDAVFLSDIRHKKAFLHGGVIRDKAYGKGLIALDGIEYPKGLTTHPELSPKGAHGEVVYDLRPYVGKRTTFRALVGMQDGRSGSVTFKVYTRKGKGPWKERAHTGTMTYQMAPIEFVVPLNGADELRLYVTDAGDGINSDHGVWAMARLK